MCCVWKMVHVLFRTKLFLENIRIWSICTVWQLLLSAQIIESQVSFTTICLFSVHGLVSVSYRKKGQYKINGSFSKSEDRRESKCKCSPAFAHPVKCHCFYADGKVLSIHFQISIEFAFLRLHSFICVEWTTIFKWKVVFSKFIRSVQIHSKTSRVEIHWIFEIAPFLERRKYAEKKNSEALAKIGNNSFVGRIDIFPEIAGETKKTWKRIRVVIGLFLAQLVQYSEANGKMNVFDTWI